jgi:molecular chaperone DnaK (HSP70)
MGLDYGTTNSCVALLEGGKPRVIENLEGERISASVVAVNEDGSKIVGTPARRQVCRLCTIMPNHSTTYTLPIGYFKPTQHIFCD